MRKNRLFGAGPRYINPVRLALIALAVAGLLFLSLPAAAPHAGQVSEDLVRLHVIADSDGERDQAIKLCVRDVVREQTAQLLSRARSSQEALSTLAKAQGDIELAARQEARRQGFAGPVRVELGKFAFPERSYAGEVVPAGEYNALKVILGSGEGRNWWCVLYPNLCALEPDGGTAEQAALLSLDAQPVTFHSVICDWILDLFGGRGECHDA